MNSAALSPCSAHVSDAIRWSFSDSSVAAERRFAIETTWLVHAEVRRFAGRATGWCAALFDGRLRLTRVIWLGIASQTPPRELIQAGVSAFEPLAALSSQFFISFGECGQLFGPLLV